MAQMVAFLVYKIKAARPRPEAAKALTKGKARAETHTMAWQSVTIGIGAFLANRARAPWPTFA